MHHWSQLTTLMSELQLLDHEDGHDRGDFMTLQW
jgi:hypothetical protein